MDCTSSGAMTQTPCNIRLISAQTHISQPNDNWTGVTDPALRKKLQNKLNQRALRARKRQERQNALLLKSQNSRSDVRRYALILPRTDNNKVQAPQQQPPRLTSLIQAVEMMTRFQAEARERYYAADPCLDHLFTLTKFNVLRAFVDNMSALGLTIEALDEDVISPFCTPMPRHRDPQNINIPPSLLPTVTQSSTPHHPWLDCFPFPRMRDNLVQAAEAFNDCELCADIVDPTGGDIGIMVWGDPWLPQNWEFSATFVRKWSWIIEGCPGIFMYSNYWRARRGLKKL